MIKETIHDLAGRPHMQAALALLVFGTAAVVVVNIFGGLFALIFDAAVIAAFVVIRLTCDIITMPPFFRPRHKPLPFHEGEAEGGRLVISNGIPVLVLRGSNHQMGRQAGLLMGEQVRVLIHDFLNYVFRNAKKKRAAMERARALEKHIPPAYLDELRGMSETCGVSYDELLLANTFTEDYRLFLCSTFCARGAASADKKTIMGRNLDFISVGVLYYYNTVIVYHPDGGNAFALFGYPGFIGAITGMNSLGLTSAMLISFSGGFSTEHIPSTIAFRMVLEKCATVAEAAALMKENPIAAPSNLSLVDESGGMCAVEISHQHFAVREPERNVLMCTNTFLVGRFSGLRPDWRTRLLGRFAQSERGNIDVQSAKRAMRMAYLFLVNLQCLVILPRERTVHISWGKIPAAKGRFRTLNLDIYFQ